VQVLVLAPLPGPAAPVEKRLWGFVVGIVFITIADALKER